MKFLAIILAGFIVWRKFRRDRLVAALLMSLLVFAAGYLAYTKVFPGDDFYRDDFRRHFGIGFPESGVFVHKQKSLPSIGSGDDSCAVFSLTTNDMVAVENLIGDSQPPEVFDRASDCGDFIESEYGSDAGYYKRRFWEEEGLYRELGILDDRQHVLYVVSG